MTNNPKYPSGSENKLDDETLRWLLTLKELDNRLTDETTRELFYSLVEMDLDFHKRDCRRAFHAGYVKGLKQNQARRLKK